MKTLLTLLALAFLALPARAQRVTDLPPGNAVGNTDLFLDVQGYTGSGTGTTTKVSGAQLKAYLPATTTLPWGSITSTPTTLAGYGITDPVVLTTGAYVNPTWITSLPYSKLTGVPTLGSLAALSSINNGNWSGTALSVSNGGTGTSTPSLIGGANVTVTGTWPNQTIAASGGSGGVTSFNTRTGSITLTSSDVNAAGTLSNNTTGTATYATTAGSTGTYTGATLGIFGTGTTTIQVVPPGSIYAAVGDSITMGTPYVLATTGSQTSITGTDTLGNTGYSYVQYLSGLPRWHNILCYDFGVSGSRSNAGVGVVTGSSQPGGTLYENGAVVGTVGGATMSLATLYSNLAGQGKLIVGTMYGTNDPAGSITAPTTLTNLEATYAAIHDLGPNAVAVGITVPQCGANMIGSSNMQDINTQLYTAMHGITPSSSLPDTLADLGGLLSQFPTELITAGYQNGDWVHLQNKGYQLFAQEVDRACFFGFVRQASIIYPRYTPTIDATLSGGASYPCFDLNSGDILFGVHSQANVEFDAINQQIDRFSEGAVLDFNAKLLLTGGVTTENWGNRALMYGSTIDLSWATQGQIQINGMLCGIPNVGTANQAGTQMIIGNGLGLGNVALPMLIENPTATTSGGTVQTRSVDASIWPDGGVYIGTGTTTDPGAHALQITGPLTVAFTTASASFSLTQGVNFFTGSTASQTGTLPVPTVPGQEVFIKNQSSVALTVASNSGTQIIATGATTASASVTVASGADAKFYSDGTSWNQL